MENEIKKLIEKWEYLEGWQNDYAAAVALSDFKGLLDFKQKKCCGKQTPNGIKEVYEKYNHLDHLLSDKEWVTPDKSEVSPAYTICYELWRAIKNECA